MKSHEAARITNGERIIAHTREELCRPEVTRALGVYAQRTLAILDNLYVPHVVGGVIMIPSAMRDTDAIPLVLSRSSRRLAYPTETTPTQIRQARAQQAHEWQGVSSDALTQGELDWLAERPYETHVKLRDTYYASGVSAFAVARTPAVTYSFRTVDSDVSRMVAMTGKPFVSIDPSLASGRSRTFIAGALIHELQHVDDALQGPVAIYAEADEARWDEDDILRSELRAYTVEALYLHARGADGDDEVANVMEVAGIRQWYNGSVSNGSDPYAPTPEIKRELARQGITLY